MMVRPIEPATLPTVPAPTAPASLSEQYLVDEPLERAFTIPSRWYTDPAYHTFDQQSVIASTWQYVGHLSQIPHPGDYIAAEIAGEDVVIVRAEDHSLKAFFNVCRHRGGPLVTQRCGSASPRVLKCKYHGWTYRLDGSLRGVPRFDRSELFDKKDFALVPVSVETFQGVIFVRLVPDGPSLQSVMNGVDERIAPLSLHGLTFAKRVTYRIACNWKVYVDNYLEGYHLPLVHPELCKVLDYRAYKTETATYYSLQHSPLQSTENPYHSSGDDVAAYYYFVYPNTMYNIVPGRLQMNSVIPIDADTCEVIFDYFYDTDEPEAVAMRLKDDLTFSEQVQQEDIDICERVQRGLHSRAYDRGRFSVEMEAGVHHFQQLLKASYRDAVSQKLG